ncbi:hypothetical protein M9H77_31500 [Catharanthus roseus]|uniref:Uncharacterized protein n=1 Tax=Catharanthus roseus TaxID=4058 RepID=A0ACC0A0B3_CATRO|nr:hypothetical protein M9H77_31500 [Catharanthus roseus]
MTLKNNFFSFPPNPTLISILTFPDQNSLLTLSLVTLSTQHSNEFTAIRIKKASATATTDRSFRHCYYLIGASSFSLFLLQALCKKNVDVSKKQIIPQKLGRGMIYLETHVNKDGTHFNNETKEICRDQPD